MPIVSPALREVANLKIKELKHFKDQFAKDILLNLNKAYNHREARDVILARLTKLLECIHAYKCHGAVDDYFSMWNRFVEQAQDDKSITSVKLISMEKSLHRKLEEIGDRLVMSEYHVSLIDSALHTMDAHVEIGPALDKISLDDEFEMIEEDVESGCSTFEENAFGSKAPDIDAIEDYLAHLFEDAVGDAQLRMLRQQMVGYGNGLLCGEDDIDTEFVEWCIKDLLKNGLLSAEKQIALQEYLQSEQAIRELTTTLNSKSIHLWDWHTGGEGLSVSFQKDAEGKQCIVVEENIIDMLFLHSLAMRWGMELKEGLKRLTSTRMGEKESTDKVFQKRRYYLEGPRPQQPASCTTCHPPMPLSPSMYPGYSGGPPPPIPPPQHISPPYNPTYRRRRNTVPAPPPHGVTRSKRSRRVSRARGPPPPPPEPALCIDEERCNFYMQNLILYRLPDINGSLAARSVDTDRQGFLLQMLAMEIKTREAFDGSVHGLRVNFRSFASALPHDTILTTLKYIGVPEEWISFFKRFLRAPLNIRTITRDASDHVRTRTCGVPIAHGLGTFFEEAVLFCLDLAVRHRTSSEQTTPYLLRQRDQCYFAGKRRQCEEVQEHIAAFATIMGLDVSVNDLFPPASESTSAVGLITFNRNGAECSIRPNGATLTVDMTRVASYAHRVKKQLADCPTLFAWVAMWNRTIGTYASHLFGQVAHVVDGTHFEDVKRAYNLMYEIIFDGDGNLTRHVTDLLPLPFPSANSTFSHEAWIHLPAAYGGLGVNNPYAILNYDSGIMPADPVSMWTDYLNDEKKYYESVADIFQGHTTKQREEKLKGIFDGDEERIAAVFGSDWKTATATFPTLQELTAGRERLARRGVYIQPNPFAPPNTAQDYPYVPLSPTLGDPPNPLNIYHSLAMQPFPSDYDVSDRVRNGIARLAGKPGMNPFDFMNVQDRWALAFYGDECFERFGGLEIWYGDGVPRELLRVLRGEEYVEETGFGLGSRRFAYG